VEFAGPLLAKLGQPTLFCNTLSVETDGSISGYNLRQADGKQKVTIALQSLNYQVIAIGDSYNDISMLKAAERAILYCPPDNVKKEYSEFTVARTYDELRQAINNIIETLL
jgi:phosphoserine/homoserine phosphotransferase